MRDHNNERRLAQFGQIPQSSTRLQSPGPKHRESVSAIVAALHKSNNNKTGPWSPPDPLDEHSPKVGDVRKIEYEPLGGAVADARKKGAL